MFTTTIPLHCLSVRLRGHHQIGKIGGLEEAAARAKLSCVVSVPGWLAVRTVVLQLWPPAVSMIYTHQLCLVYCEVWILLNNILQLFYYLSANFHLVSGVLFMFLFF